MDAVNPVTSSELIDQAPEDVTVSTDCTVEREYEYNTRTIKDVEFPSGDINGEIEEVPKENVSMVVSAVVTDVNQGDDIPKIESELCENHATKDQNQDSINENVGAGLAGPLDQSPYFLSRSIQIQKKNEIPVEATAAVSTEPVVKEIRDNLEAFQPRGLARRLQFEDVDTVISNQHDQGPPSCGGPVSPLDAPLTPIQSKQAETVLPQHPRNTNTTVKIPKRSGIGLHLNSIVSTVHAGSGAIIHVKSAQRYNVSIRGKKPTPITSSHLSNSLSSSSVFTIREDVSKSMDDDRRESHATLAVNSVTSLSNNIVKPSDNSVILKPVDESTSSNKRIYSNIDTDGNSEEFRSSPKKKRKISSDPGDGDGCKRCNCKKSQCLKLYCDCFAAGMYCAGPCACQGCYNRPEYVDTVLETRQQIESRNPLAFAPKIVQHTIEPPTSSCGEDGTYSTPSSARHKRGCNCKKSMCLKKYCECYQANVGCSDGCGCEGCKNVYGRKGEKGAYKDVLHKEGANERADCLFIGKKMQSLNPQNLTPVTPEVQLSNQRKDESKAWINSARHFQSPGWNLTPGDVLDLVSSDQELTYDNSKDQSFHANDHYSSMSSLSWCGSPSTPTAPFSVSKPLKAVDFDGKLPYTAMEDDTPDILKESSAPDNAVKVSSPNKKRVSPPHGPQHEFVSSSMVGLRTGRKFILKAVSSCPPLTPCVDSRSTVSQQKNDPQNHTNNK